VATILSGIEIQGLVYRYGPRLALDHVSLQVSAGRIIGLLGANGAGKSTLLKLLCGLLAPAAGSILVAGAALPAARRGIGYVAQTFGLYEDLSVLENLEFYGRACGLGRAVALERVEAALARFRLTDRRRDRTGSLSHGWRQRVAMACALLHRPAVLLLDEATAGLDPAARRHAWQVVEEEAARGAAVLLSTHHLDEAARCHSVAFLNAGRLAGCGPYAEAAAALDEHFEMTR
jgi:ABC-2 type transport system ATP-binding protein